MKKKYLEDCVRHRRDFTPFIISTDGLLGKEAQLLLKKLASLLSTKWRLPYSQVMNYVKTRMSIAVTRSMNTFLCGSRIPVSKISEKYPIWEDGAGMYLFN